MIPSPRHRVQTSTAEQTHARCPDVPPWSVILPASGRAPELARVRVEEDGCPEHGRYARPVLGLLVEELVGRLTVPGARWVTVCLACEVVEMRAVVSVVRSGPARRRPAASDVTWQLVDKVARRWGRDRDTDAESVWCVVPTGELPARAAHGPVVPRQRGARQATGWTASQPA
ncbi:MAG: hypothetical protein ACTHOK_17825 [Nocardioidaceae bacterium]